MSVGVVALHVSLSAASDCAMMVGKVRVTNGIQKAYDQEAVDANMQFVGSGSACHSRFLL